LADMVLAQAENSPLGPASPSRISVRNTFLTNGWSSLSSASRSRSCRHRASCFTRWRQSVSGATPRCPLRGGWL